MDRTPSRLPAFKTFASFEEFWPFYLSQHSKLLTRWWHFIGTSLMFICLFLAIAYTAWFLLAAPLVAYGLAWYSHFFVEGNKPATFGYPFWSLRADFRMFLYMLLGKIAQEYDRLNIPRDDN